MRKILFLTGAFLLLIIYGSNADEVRLSMTIPRQDQIRGVGGVVGNGPNNLWDWRTQAITDDNFYVGGRLGIGTISPRTQFELNTNVPSVGSMGFGSFADGIARDMWYDGGDDTEFIIANTSPLASGGTKFVRVVGGIVTPLLYIGNNGRVGIGTETPQATLDVRGNARYIIYTYPSSVDIEMTNVLNDRIYYNFYVSGGGTYAYTVTLTASSKRFKENITDLELDTSKIYGLRPVSFNWKKDRGGARDFGIIAEEAAKISPLLVSYDKEGKPFTVRYELLSVLLLNELKKKAAEMDELEKTLAQLEARAMKLKARRGRRP